MADEKIKSQTRELLRSHEDLLLSVKEQLKAHWRSQSPKRDSSDETMYELGKQEGMSDGVDLFIAELERIAHETP